MEYKTLFQCVATGHNNGNGYHLVDFACKVSGKKYNVGSFVPAAKDVYKCVRQITGYVYLIYIPINRELYNYFEEIGKGRGLFAIIKRSTFWKPRITFRTYLPLRWKNILQW